MIEDSYEQRLHGNSPTGAIFALKNFGWKDKSEPDHLDRPWVFTGIVADNSEDDSV